jgi:protein-S-isoprenylcysteine O-methyltransferase Ste14
MTDASGGSFLYNDDCALLAHRCRTKESNGGNGSMVAETRENGSRLVSLIQGIKNLVGAGMYLLLLGLVLEGLAVVVRPWISFSISLDPEAQILSTVLCVGACLLGVIWFNRSLNLIKVHLLDGEAELITSGPFAYVRHPLYATLLMTIPPLFVVWFSDLLFLVPWVLLTVVAHSLVRIEERGLAEAFGQDYERYRIYVPALLPYKGAGGKRYRRQDHDLGNRAQSY